MQNRNICTTSDSGQFSLAATFDIFHAKIYYFLNYKPWQSKRIKWEREREREKKKRWNNKQQHQLPLIIPLYSQRTLLYGSRIQLNIERSLLVFYMQRVFTLSIPITLVQWIFDCAVYAHWVVCEKQRQRDKSSKLNLYSTIYITKACLYI